VKTSVPQQPLYEIPDLETAFKDWVTDTGSTQSTADHYWSRIKTFPYFSLQENSSREIVGLINKRLSDANQKTAISQFIRFLYEEYEAYDVNDEEYTDLQFKKKTIISNIELKQTASTSEFDTQSINRHFIYSRDLVQLLELAEPDRAAFWFCLYAGGFRIGELLRLTPNHLRPSYGNHGAIVVPVERTKSKEERTIEFHSPAPIQILQSRNTDTWVDDYGNKWDNVFFAPPEFYAQKENYYISKYGEKIGVENRSSHSFRHTRITHLIHDDEHEKDYVRRRSGHASEAVTNIYTELSFDRKPVPLEQYCSENDIDILQAIEKN
jgi:integrase